MAHYYRQDAVHSAPRALAHPTPSHPTPSHPMAARQSVPERAARIDCDTCPIAGRGCGDCMVALLGPVRLRLDEAEQRAVERLVRAGLVSPEVARDAHAEPDLPDWVTETWPQTHDSEERLRAIG